MDAYIYQAALLCEDCARQVKAEAHEYNAEPDDADNSDVVPQGPYHDGGGEADCPQHCDHCAVFLENPLTTDGYQYVKDAVFRIPRGLRVEEWRVFYGVTDPYDPGLTARRK